MALDDHDQHFIGPVAQKAFIEQDGKVLMVQYPSDDPAASSWDLPGGRLHADEEALVGLCREVKEEINADIAVEGIMTTLVSRGRSFTSFMVIYRASLTDPAQELSPEAGEIGAIEWIDKKEVLELPFANPALTEALKAFL